MYYTYGGPQLYGRYGMNYYPVQNWDQEYSAKPYYSSYRPYFVYSNPPMGPYTYFSPWAIKGVPPLSY